MAEKKHAIAVPAALYPEDVEYINRAVKGDNFSKKLRAIIHEHQAAREGIAQYSAEGVLEKAVDGALLAYEKSEGETSWTNAMPFPYNKKNGWQGLQRAATEAGFRCQIYENKALGHVAVWLAPEAVTKCQSCKQKLQQVVEAL